MDITKKIITNFIKMKIKKITDGYKIITREEIRIQENKIYDNESKYWVECKNGYCGREYDVLIQCNYDINIFKKNCIHNGIKINDIKYYLDPKSFYSDWSSNYFELILISENNFIKYKENIPKLQQLVDKIKNKINIQVRKKDKNEPMLLTYIKIKEYRDVLDASLKCSKDHFISSIEYMDKRKYFKILNCINQLEDDDKNFFYL